MRRLAARTADRSGPGWLPSVIDTLMAEYHLTLRDAMLFPLEAYLALIPALVARRGGQGSGPDYIDNAAIAAREACWRFLRRHFTILPQGEPGPAGALHQWLANRAPTKPKKDN